MGFRAVFECPPGDSPMLRIAGSSLYRIYLNGQFAGHGPARGPHGFYRVDEWPLGRCAAGKNTLAIEVAGYNVNSFYLLDQPAFLQAEVVSHGRVLASTAGQGVPFEATILTQRLQKVQRYSFQRPFIEYYRLSAGDDHWWDKPAVESTASIRAARPAIVGPPGGLSAFPGTPADPGGLAGQAATRRARGATVERPLARQHRPAAERLSGGGTGGRPFARVAEDPLGRDGEDRQVVSTRSGLRTGGEHVCRRRLRHEPDRLRRRGRARAPSRRRSV